jgi:hypothetical protein
MPAIQPPTFQQIVVVAGLNLWENVKRAWHLYLRQSVALDGSMLQQLLRLLNALQSI